MKKILVTMIMLLTFITTNVFATEYEEGLINRIAPDGKNVTIKANPPKSMEEADLLLYGLINNMLNDSAYDAYPTCEEPDFTKCIISISGLESDYQKDYEVTITYDKPVENKEVSSYISNFKRINMDEYDSYYKVTDLGLINYYLTSNKSELWNPGAASRALKYSNEIINITKGSNISFIHDVRAGDQADDLMFENAYGPMNVIYNGYSYGYVEQGVHLKRVIYIPENTEDNVLAYISAAKKRINDYLGNGEQVSIRFGGALADLDQMALDPTIDSSITDGNYYLIDILDKTYRFYILKDDEMVKEGPTYIGKNIESNITIKTDYSQVPLDTTFTVKNVSDESIEKVIGTNDYIAYDMTLYSTAAESKIEQINDNKFVVSIPIPEKYKGKSLIVYYINSNNEKEEHSVPPGEFATFETNHFSTYILTEKVTESGSDDSIKEPEEELPEVPQTGDNLVSYVIISSVSLIVLTISLIAIRKQGLN